MSPLDIVGTKKQLAAVDPERLEEALRAAFMVASAPQEHFVVLKLSNDKNIRQLNRAFTGLDESTDVLSFENDYTDLETGAHFIGDIVISLETAERQASAHSATLQQELEMLLIHGVLHLLGYDHLDAESQQDMAKAQDAALKAISNPLLGSIASVTAQDY
jgi:rRNA maturation RNase YbeY